MNMIKNILILLLTLFIFLAIKPFFFGSSPDSLDQKIFSFITHPFSQKYYVGTEEEFVSKRLTSASNDEYINKIVKSSFNVNEEKEAVFKLFLHDFLKNEDFQKLIYAKLRTMAVVDKDGYAKSKDDFLKNMEQLSLNLPQEISASSMKLMQSEYQIKEIENFLFKLEFYKKHRYFNDCKAFITGNSSISDIKTLKKITSEIFNEMSIDDIKDMIENRKIALLMALNRNFNDKSYKRMTDAQRQSVADEITMFIDRELLNLPESESLRLKKALSNMSISSPEDACDGGILLLKAYLGEGNREVKARFFFER